MAPCFHRVTLKGNSSVEPLKKAEIPTFSGAGIVSGCISTSRVTTSTLCLCGLMMIFLRRQWFV